MSTNCKLHFIWHKMSYVKTSKCVNLNHLKMLSRDCFPPKILSQYCIPPKMMSRDWTPPPNDVVRLDLPKWCRETAPLPPQIMLRDWTPPPNGVARLHPPKMMLRDCTPPKNYVARLHPPPQMNLFIGNSKKLQMAANTKTKFFKYLS